MNSKLVKFNSQNVGAVGRFRPINRQSGMTFWTLLFVAALAVCASYVVMQLVPIYAVNANIKNAMELTIEESDLRRVNRSQVIRSLNQQLYLDESHRVLDYKRDLKVSRSRNKFVMQIDYEREVPLVANTYLVVRFSNIEERELN